MAMRPSSKRILLAALAVLVSASAALAIGILLVGDFDDTEGRILATTAILAGYGLVALPGTILLDQNRSMWQAVTNLALAVAAASIALVALWATDTETVGKTVGTVTAFALASTQLAALAARRQRRDPPAVRLLFLLSGGLAPVLAAMYSAVIWAEPGGTAFVRFLAALLVLDLMFVALQPILARLRAIGVVQRLAIADTSGATVRMEVEAADLAAAVAKSIRALERDGRRVVRIEVGEPVMKRSPSRGDDDDGNAATWISGSADAAHTPPPEYPPALKTDRE